MKSVFVGLFALFAFVVVANANFITVRSPSINLTPKFQQKLKEITDELPEPIELFDQNIQLYEDLNVTLSGTISGLKAFACNDLQLGILGALSISNFEFALPKLRIDITNYDLNGKLGLTPIYGNGQIVLNIDNIVLKGNAKLGVKTINGVQFVHITRITAYLTIDINTFNFKITGLLNDEIQSEFLSKIINNFVHNITPETTPIVNEQISRYLTAAYADIKIPLMDLLKP